jgi:tetratricopeptide (TPR) repeat protein
MLVSLALAALPSPASLAAPAAAVREAKQHFRRGATEYNLGHFQEAIAEFEKAYQLDPSPILLFNIGQAHRKLGNGSQAIFFFRRYLNEDPETKDRPKVEQWIHELEEAAARQPAPTPERGTPSTSPTPTTPTPTTTAPPPLAPALPDSGVISSPDQPPRQPAAWQRPAAWATAAVAVGALALGIQQAVRYSDKRSAFAAIPACGEAEMNRGADARCQSLYDSGQGAKTLSVVGFVAGGILGGASAALFVLSRSAEPTSRTARLQGCRVLGLAASCQFVF